MSDIHTLEEIVQHQERQIQDLSDMVAAQWQDIDKLKKSVVMLQQKLVTMTQDQMDGQSDPMSVTEIALRDKPPHY